MTALLLAVLTASLLGSAHCAGMCGPLMLLATDVVQIGPLARPPRWAYHVSRGLAYAALGALAGGLAATLELAVANRGMRIAGFVAASAVALFGVAAMLDAAGWRRRSWLPPVLQRLQYELGTRIARRPARQRAFGMGLLSVLLPCGWLYAFVAVAAGTGSPAAGAAVMAAFWIGTVPALALVGLTARRLSLRWPSLRLATAALVTLVGTGVASSRWQTELRLYKDGADACESAEAALAHAIKETPACCR
jgi:sulfite exporter TauE/SafE